MDIYSEENQLVLDTISRHCPKALSTYLHILNRVNDDGSCFFSKQMITDDMSESWCKFINSLKSLTRENLIEWHYLHNGVAIVMVDFNAHE